MNAQFERDDLTLFISFISEQIVRVRVCSGAQKKPYPSFAIVADAVAKVCRRQEDLRQCSR